MEGVIWGAIAGIVFGLFQATNRRANLKVDAFLSTFIVILVSLGVVAVLAFIAEEPMRLVGVRPPVLVAFASAGIMNFFLGWTFLALAQQQAGAARTSVVAGTAPLFGTALAFVAIGESVSPAALLGVVLVVLGVTLLASGQSASAAVAASGAGWGLFFALMTAVTWGASAVLARYGLNEVAMPLSGVMLGLAGSAVLYGLALSVRRAGRGSGHSGSGALLPHRARGALVVTGLLVGIALSTQWIAFSLAPTAIVMALNQLAVPVVLVVAPSIVGAGGERLTRRALVGTAIVLVGTLLIIVARGGPGT